MNWIEPSKSGANIDNGKVNIKETHIFSRIFKCARRK